LLSGTVSVAAPPGCAVILTVCSGIPRRRSAGSVPPAAPRRRDARAPRVCPVVGVRAACPRRRDAGGTPALPGCAPSWECEQRALGDATRAGRPRSQGVPRRGSAGSVPYRGGFLKPLRAIFRFSHQDAQKPPSPLVGEGGWGDEGQKRSGKQKITHRSQEIYP
jgi:hypothetical protein